MFRHECNIILMVYHYDMIKNKTFPYFLSRKIKNLLKNVKCPTLKEKWLNF